MNEENWSDKAKIFLAEQSTELQDKIEKLKRKRKTVKILFGTFIVTSIVCSTVCAILGAFAVPPVAISIISTTGALSTALSLKFKLKHKQNDLNRNIDKLDKVKNKIDYIVSCNGNFSQKEFQELIEKLN
jgi:hypothetical protein